MAEGRTDAEVESEKDTKYIAKTGFLGYVIRHAQDIEFHDDASGGDNDRRM
ncbi:MAG TPA: hypothetical protein PLZ82_02860 [Smithellaceae bacterium]|jgi:hypothetical protein|nr:hypothetical protein [Syntrophaceae bacterium]NMC92617.1 hypothetical protein [Smithella sp.]OQC71212.1 MAG: hypothetical protein BWX45_01229 [Deltaproteobacteria bacterium ADurb.Bin002]HOD63509.1 hypothetical protein [Smithellaceae bacterium]MBP9651247.1 hypothetical protein [Syntrophaceae bacterium]